MVSTINSQGCIVFMCWIQQISRRLQLVAWRMIQYLIAYPLMFLAFFCFTIGTFALYGSNIVAQRCCRYSEPPVTNKTLLETV